MIIALGESIVAIGVGAKATIGAGVVAAAVLGIVVAAALWWAYFDVAAIVAARRLAKAAPGRERNEIARDSYSYLHFPMVAGIALIAVGIKRTLIDVDEPLSLVAATALLGGAAMYLLAHVAFRLRNMHSLSIAAAGVRDRAARAAARRRGAARAGHARHPRGRAVRADRLRGAALCRRARPRAPPARARAAARAATSPASTPLRGEMR